MDIEEQREAERHNTGRPAKQKTHGTQQTITDMTAQQKQDHTTQETNKAQVLTITTSDPDLKQQEKEAPLKVLHYDWPHSRHVAQQCYEGSTG